MDFRFLDAPTRAERAERCSARLARLQRLRAVLPGRGLRDRVSPAKRSDSEQTYSQEDNRSGLGYRHGAESRDCNVIVVIVVIVGAGVVPQDHPEIACAEEAGVSDRAQERIERVQRAKPDRAIAVEVAVIELSLERIRVVVVGASAPGR